MSSWILQGLAALWPEVCLSLGALLVVLIGVFSRRPWKVVAASAGVIVATAVALWMSRATPDGAYFSRLIVLDQTSEVFRWIALGVVALVGLMAAGSIEVDASWTGEYFGLVLLVGVGLMLMAEANHLLMAYLAIELVSLSSYLLVAFLRDARSSEAALKYLLFGALSSGIMLFGLSLLYGLTGVWTFPQIRQAILSTGPLIGAPVAVASVLILAGLAFKISIVPFHLWTPDVYEGAPIPVTAMLSVGPKAAGLALLFRIGYALGPVWAVLEPAFFVFTMITMTLGNVAGLVQTNIKRLLAYSTIGQVGYLLIGFSVNTPMGWSAMLVYLAAYLIMNLGAFACVVAVARDAQSESLEAFRGLAKRSPLLAACLAVFLLSLAGLPPFVGFMGKFLLFGSAIESHQATLAFVGILNSAIALYYYVNIIRLMYLLPPERPAALQPAWSLRLATVVCGAATVALGVFPGLLLAWLGIKA